MGTRTLAMVPSTPISFGYVEWALSAKVSRAGICSDPGDNPSRSSRAESILRSRNWFRKACQIGITSCCTSEWSDSPWDWGGLDPHPQFMGAISSVVTPVSRGTTSVTIFISSARWVDNLGRLLDPTKGRRRFFRKDLGFGLCLMLEQKRSLKVFGRGERSGFLQM